MEKVMYRRDSIGEVPRDGGFSFLDVGTVSGG